MNMCRVDAGQGQGLALRLGLVGLTLLGAIDGFAHSLSGLREAIAASDGSRIQEVFEHARSAREIYLRWHEESDQQRSHTGAGE